MVIQFERCLYWDAHLVEWDTGVLEYEQSRLARLVEWYSTLRGDVHNHNAMPFVLPIVTQDIQRLQSYYTALRAVSQARNMPLMPTYLATMREVASHAITAPIWYSAEGKNKQGLFSNLRFTANTNLAPRFPDLGRRSVTERHVIELINAVFDVSHPTSAVSLLALKRELAPQSKRVLKEVAAHPLLAASDIAMLLDDLSGQVYRALKQLTGFGLLHAVQMHNQTRYLLAETGIHYLAATDGFGRAVNAYSKAHGWKQSLSQLVRHWEHTQIENKLFLALASVARKRAAHFEWRSEPESHLYYFAQGRRWSFVPDGICTFSESKARLRIAAEIERHRSAKRRLRIKFNWYAVYVDATLYRTTHDEEFRILVVTASWQRANTIRRILMEQARLRGTSLLPVWLTTFELFSEQGVEKPIWRKADTWERANCV